jgi:hypothetical protein
VKLTKEEFKALQDLWYKKAQDSGFKDIENTNGNERYLKTDALDSYGKEKDKDRIVAVEEYFTILSHIAEDPETKYKDPSHKIIMIRFAEGAKIKNIVAELQLLGLSRDRKNVRLIIRRYEEKWKLKNPKRHTKS